ncbi:MULTISPECIES: sugar-binding transcriptional regulator [Actinomycetes]|uniref:sugar-binding transcriptional regulator n=1 Tax=Actinomycetes TaxID=1760 RepID=UPI0010A87929|nr:MULTISPECIES: sugar-binding domain-containing protein [Actinomycetes]
MNPEELVQTTHAARRYYLDNASHVSIAAELGISRFKVARMIDKARELGIVRIEIQEPVDVDTELSIALGRAFGLRRAVVIRTPGEEPRALQEALGKAAARLLEEIVVEGDMLGFTSGRTLNAMARHLTRLPASDLVALSGVAAGSVKEHSVEIMRRVATASSGASYPIFAPLLVQSPATAAALRSDPLIADAFAHFDHVTKGVVAVGSWDPPDSQLYDAAIESGIAERLVARGAVGEVAAVIYDENGRVMTDIDELTIAITADQLRRIPEVIAVAGGERKTRAVEGALTSGLVQSLVTDAALAERLLTKRLDVS